MTESNRFLLIIRPPCPNSRTKSPSKRKLKTGPMTDSPGEPKRTQNPPPLKQPGWKSGVHYPNPPDPQSTTAWSWRSGVKYPNPPDPVNPDPLTLREQWLFAIRNYSRWYSRAWGAAILAGATLYYIGWMLKGSDPVHSHPAHKPENPDHDMPELATDK